MKKNFNHSVLIIVIGLLWLVIGIAIMLVCAYFLIIAYHYTVLFVLIFGLTTTASAYLIVNSRTSSEYKFARICMGINLLILSIYFSLGAMFFQFSPIYLNYIFVYFLVLSLLSLFIIVIVY